MELNRKAGAPAPADSVAMLLQQLHYHQTAQGQLRAKSVSSGHRCADDLSLVEVNQLRGKIIQRFGFSRGGRTFLRLEEAAWLADQGQLVLTQDPDATAQQGEHAALLTPLLRGGYRIEVYSTFALLSELGYIVRTRCCQAAPSVVVRSISDSTALYSRPVKRQRLETARAEPSTDAGVGPGAGDNGEFDEASVAGPHAPLGPNFVHLDVFTPDKTFRRSAPGTPHYVVSVCAANCASPSAAQVRQLAASEHGSTLLHVVASGAEVQILSLAPRRTDEFDLRDGS